MSHNWLHTQTLCVRDEMNDTDLMLYGHTHSCKGQGKHMQRCLHRSGTAIVDKHASQAGGWRVLCGE